MKYLAAYLLLTIGGNTAPAAKDVSALLATVGIEAEAERIESLIAQLAGKDINEVKSSYCLVSTTNAFGISCISSCTYHPPSSLFFLLRN